MQEKWSPRQLPGTMDRSMPACTLSPCVRTDGMASHLTSRRLGRYDDQVSTSSYVVTLEYILLPKPPAVRPTWQFIVTAFRSWSAER